MKTSVLLTAILTIFAFAIVTSSATASYPTSYAGDLTVRKQASGSYDARTYVASSFKGNRIRGCNVAGFRGVLRNYKYDRKVKGCDLTGAASRSIYRSGALVVVVRINYAGNILPVKVVVERQKL